MLPFHNYAARVDAAICCAAVTTDTVRCNAVHRWRRCWALYFWRKRCLSAAVSTCAALHDAARVYAGLFFLCTCSDSYCPLQSVYYSSRRYCTLQLLIVQVGTTPFDAVLGGKQPLGCGRTHLFYNWSWYYTTPFKAVGVVVTRGHRSNLAAISTTVGSTVPLQCCRWGNCLFRTPYYPSWCGWNCRCLLTQRRYYSHQQYRRRVRPPIVQTMGKLPCSGVILSLYSAVGGRTALFRRYTTHLGAVGIAVTC